jgi:hypothetical protein
MKLRGFALLLVAVVAGVTSGCAGNAIREAYSGDMSAQSLPPEVLGEVRWRMQWARAFADASALTSKDGVIGKDGHVATPLDDKSADALVKHLAPALPASLAAEFAAPDAANPFAMRARLSRLAACLEKDAQTRLVDWVCSSYGPYIRARLHPASSKFISEIRFDAKPLAAGAQGSRKELDASVLFAGKAKADYTLRNEAVLEFRDGQPVAFSVLYVVNPDEIDALFTQNEGNCLRLKGAPMDFFYFPQVFWKIRAAHTVGAGDPAGAIVTASLGYVDVEDKTLSYSLSNPILCDSNEAAFYRTTSRVGRGDFGVYGNEKLFGEDTYPAYMLRVEGEGSDALLRISPGFEFCKVKKSEGSESRQSATQREMRVVSREVVPGRNAAEYLHRDHIPTGEESTWVVVAAPPQPEGAGTKTRAEPPPVTLERPLAFIRCKWDAENGSCNVTQLIVKAYAYRDRKGVGQMAFDEHPAERLRIKITGSSPSASGK